MSQTTENLSEYLKQLDSYMKRLENNELSINDRKLFFDLSIEYYGIFQVAEGFPEELLQGMLEFSNNITEQFDDSKELARKYRDDFVQHANEYIDTTLRSELSFGIFDIDSEIFKLEREKIQMMQKLADLDIKMYGKLTEQTQEILEVQNCEILNGQVREVLPWERTDSIPEIAGYQDEMEQQKDNAEKKEESSMEKMRVISKEELDQILNEHFRESQSGRGVKTLDLSNCIISNYVFKGDLSAISFDRSDLRYCEFRMTKAENVSFQNAALADCKLTQAEFDHCNFNNADINGTVIRNSMFREGSFDAAYMRLSPIDNSIFYRTSFADTRIREFRGSENIFYECGHPENTVRPDAGAMTQEESAQYVRSLREMFSNDGYIYSWKLIGVDPENYAADLSIKISHDGEIVEEEKYSALLNPDTYAISHIDTRRQGDSLIKMFIPEMSTAIMKYLQENIKEQEHQRVRIKFPYMTRDTFMAVRDEIKRMGAEYDIKGRAWYVDQSVGKEIITSIQDYITSHDEAIYLKLPNAGPQEFKNMIEQLKQDGARYNPDKKLWFITEKSDRNKFQQYLPVEKDSVHGKLNQYKADAKQQLKSISKEKDGQKRETPEIG